MTKGLRNKNERRRTKLIILHMPRQSPSYTPRWLYRVFGFIERLPIRGWQLALLVAVIGGLAMHLDAWRQGLLPWGQLDTYLASTSLYIVFYPGIWMVLDQRSRVALRDFFRTTRKSEAGFEAVYADFVSLPSFLGSLVFLFGSFLGFLFYDGIESPFLGRVLPIWDLISWVPITGLMFMLLYRTLRQAVVMPRLFNEIKVNLFDPSPVYAISRYASQASVALLVISYLLLSFSLPGQLFEPIAIAFQILLISASLAYFFVPLASINQRMHRAKEKLLAEIGRDLEAVYGRVHAAVQSKKFARVGEMHASIGALKDELEIIRRIPTWPWQPETLRNLVTPMLLPVIVYLMQRYVGSALGF